MKSVKGVVSEGRVYPELDGIPAPCVLAAMLAHLGWEPFVEDGTIKFRPDSRGAKELADPPKEEK